jgi:PPM family protein phosphatase
MSPAALSVAVLSRPGRREANEDACGHLAAGDRWCCVLCDGAGGHGGGDVAAQCAVQTVLQAFERDPQVAPARVAELIGLADTAVLRAQREAAANTDMRTTIVVVLIDAGEGRAVWGHAGDSRLYRWRMGRLLGHTRDHSLQQKLLDAGLATPGDRSGVSRSLLTSALGSPEGCDVDVIEAPVPLCNGDVLLLCSDGLWETLDADTLTQAMQAVPTPQGWLAALDLEVGRTARASQDNYSALALWWEGGAV